MQCFIFVCILWKNRELLDESFAYKAEKNLSVIYLVRDFPTSKSLLLEFTMMMITDPDSRDTYFKESWWRWTIIIESWPQDCFYIIILEQISSIIYGLISIFVRAIYIINNFWISIFVHENIITSIWWWGWGWTFWKRWVYCYFILSII